MVNDMDSDELTNKRIHALARRHGCGVDDINAALDAHPVVTDRAAYVRRCLSLELMHLDEYEEVFRAKALDGNDVSGALVLKIQERRATLLGLNAAPQSSVKIIDATPTNKPTSTEKILAALDRLAEDGERERLDALEAGRREDSTEH